MRLANEAGMSGSTHPQRQLKLRLRVNELQGGGIPDSWRGRKLACGMARSGDVHDHQPGVSVFKLGGD